MVDKEKELTAQEIQVLVDKDKSKRMESCQREIEVILQKHKCQLLALPRYTLDGRTVAEVQIQILP